MKMVSLIERPVPDANGMGNMRTCGVVDTIDVSSNALERWGERPQGAAKRIRDASFAREGFVS